MNLTEDITMARLFKFFYRKRPLRVKYFTYWPVKDLLNSLSLLHPYSILSLKDLTIKTLALVALTSSDRGQTIQLMDIENCSISENKISFVIFNKLKHTRKVLKPKVIVCPSSDNPSLNVCAYVKEYMARTLPYRNLDMSDDKNRFTRLFISWRTKKPVTRQTLARWLKCSLSQAGINTEQFSAHSFRGASLSTAYKSGANINQIIEAGCWTNTGTFFKHYCAPENTSEVGQIILRQGSKGKTKLSVLTTLDYTPFITWNNLILIIIILIKNYKNFHIHAFGLISKLWNQ